MEINPKKTPLSKFRGYLHQYYFQISKIVSIVLIIIIIVIIFFLLFYIIKNQLNFIDFLSILVAISLSIITYYYSIFSKKTMWQHALIDIQNEYAAPDMKEAIRFLWDVYKKDCKKDEDAFVEKYKKLYNKKDYDD